MKQAIEEDFWSSEVAVKVSGDLEEVKILMND